MTTGARQRWLTTGMIAARLGVHISTVSRWEVEGRIPPATRRNGWRVWPEETLREIEAAVMVRPGAAQSDDPD